MIVDVRTWTLSNFGRAELKDKRRSKRLLQVVQNMTLHPEASIPQASGTWGDAKAAYRLLNEPDVDPDAVQQPHRTLVAQQCAEQHRLVLVLQDASDLDFTFHNKAKGLGKIGDGRGRGLIQHTALAVEPQQGQVIGLLRQNWHKRVERDEQETAQQRLGRWRESDIWADTIRQVGPPCSGRCQYVHVCDSHGDCFNTFAAAAATQVGLLVRVMHYQRVLSGGQSLLDHLSAQAALGMVQATLHEQRDERNRIKHPQRSVSLEARTARVSLPPTRDSHSQQPLMLGAVLWMLLSSLPVQSIQEVQQAVHYYALRWRIEELHRVEKEGCRVEHAQFDDASDLMRLAAIKSVIAVRLLQLRDAAQASVRDPARLDTPQRLAKIAPRSWIQVVSKLAKIDSAKLSVTEFYRRIAMRGGWLGRKSDGPPGWKTLWRGWSELWWVVAGYELAQTAHERSG